MTVTHSELKNIGDTAITLEDLKAKGLYDPSPNLSHLENNDLIHSVDFRSIYATLLDKVIGIDHTTVLKRPFEVITFI